MRKWIVGVGLMMVMCLLGAGELYAAWPWADKPLVTIDNEEFSRADFEHWWESWQEKDMPFPKSANEYIDWLLLAREARQMELGQEPTYRKKVGTFLRARSLMLYKQEMVDSKINIADDKLWELYEAEYCPRWRLSLLYFEDEKLAAQTLQQISAGELSYNDMITAELSPEGIKPIAEKWFRRNMLPKGFLSVLTELPIGKIGGPLSMGKGFVLFSKIETIGPEKDDFNAIKKGVKKKAWKRQQGKLTVELIGKLREQYKVKIDEDLLFSLKLEDDPHGELADTVLIQADNLKVSAGEFIKLMGKEEAFRHSSGFYKDEELKSMKRRLVNNLLSQTLTSRAAIDRHYENEPPFQYVFEFYTRHRLIKELERRLFAVDAAPSDEEIAAYYQNHLTEFTKPEVVSIAVLEDDAKLGEKIWEEISRGDDFFAVAAKYYSRHPVVQEIPVKHLEATVKKVVAGLAVGEVSEPFNVQEHSTLIKLVSRRPEESVPLDHIEDKIKKLAYTERYNRLKNEYLAELKARSTIVVNDKVWAKISNKLGGGNSAK